MTRAESSKRREVEDLRDWSHFRNVGAPPPVELDQTEYRPPLMCAVGDPERICSSCQRGMHDFCRGACEDCGERYHSDGDSVYIYDTRAERDDLDAMARRGR